MAAKAPSDHKQMEIDNTEEDRPNQKDNVVTIDDTANETKDLTDTLIRDFMPGVSDETFSTQSASKYEELKAICEALFLPDLMPELTGIENLRLCDEGLGTDLANNYDIESFGSEDTEYYNSETEDEQPLAEPGTKRRKLDRRSKEVAMKTISGKRTFEEYDASEESDEDPSYVPRPVARTDTDKSSLESSSESSSESSNNDDCKEDSPMKPVQE